MAGKRISEPRLEQLRGRLGLMQEAVSAFQLAARAVGDPALTEFGLMMGEYMGLRREAVAHGHDFEAEPAAMPVVEHNLDFIRARLMSIYGPALEPLLVKHEPASRVLSKVGESRGRKEVHSTHESSPQRPGRRAF